MTTLTERYLAAALRGIPEGRRPDVEGELRSSISHAVEDRMAAGEERATAERPVLERLGAPERLRTEYGGRPGYLIGPALFPVWRQAVTKLATVVLPIVGETASRKRPRRAVCLHPGWTPPTAGVTVNTDTHDQHRANAADRIRR